MAPASLFVALLAPCCVQAASVFAHFMVGNTAQFQVSDWEFNIKLAMEAHIDAFALNMAYGWPYNYDALALAFQAAASTNFQLFFSFDYAGNGSWPMADVQSLITQYGSASTYFKYQGKPFVSTFEGPDNAEDWVTIKANTGCFFIPDWSSLGAGPAMAKANGVADGLFNWAAWPYGNNNMTTYVDASYILALTDAGAKPYMMPVSPWFYTNLPGYNKNWAWKGDNLWYDRWQQVWAVQPEFVQIISWNDFGESHYIGPLDDRQYEAFSIGEAPFNYVENMPHDGFRVHLPFMIDTYKDLQPSIELQSMVMWYRTSPAANCRDGDTTGNTAQQLQVESEPSAIFADKIFIAALLKSPASIALTDGVHAQSSYITDVSGWDMVPDGNVGIYTITFDLADMLDAKLPLVRAYLFGQSGTPSYEYGFIMADSNVTISSTCKDGLTNWNAVTAYGYDKGAGSTDKALLPLSSQGCVKGFARSQMGHFEKLCQFTCQYDYCPIGACVCTKMGIPIKPPTSGFTPVTGYPANGDDNYAGLCAFACGLGFCPSNACSTTKQTPYIPAESPFSSPACRAGTNLPGHSQYEGLCTYACNHGFCPMHVCSCTSEGGLTAPPTASSPSGTSPHRDDAGLCDFACSRGYCPSPCAYDLSLTAITWPDNSCTDLEKAMIIAELGYAYAMADSAYQDPTYGDFYKRFFSSDLTGDATWVTNLKEKYRRIRDILSGNSRLYPLSATCRKSEYCQKNPAWLAHMSDAKKTVNFCPSFWSTVEVRPGVSSQFTGNLLQQCSSINLRQVGWSKGFVLVHEATHTKYAMLDEAKTVDVAYGLGSCTELPLGTWDRSCVPYNKNGAWADANGNQGVVPGSESGHNADSYAFVAAAIYFQEKCGFAIPDPPSTTAAKKRDAWTIEDERSHARDLPVPEPAPLQRRGISSCPYVTDEWVFDGDEGNLGMTGLAHFGDSYASGMGTGSTSLGSCRVGSANYGQLIYDFVGNSSVTYKRLSCSGDRTDELMAKIDGWKTMSTTNVVTLTIGGNDVFFSDIVWNCVLTPNGARFPWRSAYRKECLQWEAKAVAFMTNTSDTGLPAKLKRAYLKILEKSGRKDLGLYVAGYPEFFNTETTTCDWSTFHYLKPGYKPHWYQWDPRFVYLTQSIRTELNGLVTQLNGVISAAVDAANAEWGGSQVTFVDVVPIFRGDVDGTDHRWCSDNSVHDPDPSRADTWFFLSGWPDAGSSAGSISEAAQDAVDLAELKAAGGVVLPNGSTCDEEGGDPWAWWLCQLAKEEIASAGRTGENLTDLNDILGNANSAIARGDYSAADVGFFLPTKQIKTFHPRTGGMYGYRDAVIKAIASYGQI